MHGLIGVMTSQWFQRPQFDRNFVNSNVESSSESESMEEDVLDGGTQAKRWQNALNRGEKLVPCACQTFGCLDGTPHYVTRRVWRAHQARDMDEPRNEGEASHQVLQSYDSPLPLLNDEMDDNEELGHEVNALSTHGGLAMNPHELSTDSGASMHGESSDFDDEGFDNDIDDSTENEIGAVEDYPELYYPDSISSASNEATDSDSSEDSFSYEFCEGMCPLYFHCTYDARKCATCLSPAFIQILRN